MSRAPLCPINDETDVLAAAAHNLTIDSHGRRPIVHALEDESFGDADKALSMPVRTPFVSYPVDMPQEFSQQYFPNFFPDLYDGSNHTIREKEFLMAQPEIFTNLQFRHEHSHALDQLGFPPSGTGYTSTLTPDQVTTFLASSARSHGSSINTFLLSKNASQPGTYTSDMNAPLPVMDEEEESNISIMEERV
ncbi:hypothetical protein BDZ94DRAFT_1315980 [Collybia nuda]|uniref:Uncharacterized protein n=1 Tax=Collybia nuda TaxID=64659 RepID=A0A9P6CC45_9AGAR|nr:hypothetical protein BDZ94DRAFT_1315980 [Collybia nuda]